MKRKIGLYKVCSQFNRQGSGSVFTFGYLDKHYRKNMTKAEAVELCKTSISLATFRDSSSGGCIRMVDIKESGCERSFIPYDSDDINPK
jgi:20S proteasome subunit beta 1